MLAERDITVSHTTIVRWVLRYVPEYEKRWERYARPVNSSWRMDETAVSVRGGLHYLYREDHRAIKRRCASMLGLKWFETAVVTFAGVELANRVRKRQFSLGIGQSSK